MHILPSIPTWFIILPLFNDIQTYISFLVTIKVPLDISLVYINNNSGYQVLTVIYQTMYIHCPLSSQCLEIEFTRNRGTVKGGNSFTFSQLVSGGLRVQTQVGRNLCRTRSVSKLSLMVCISFIFLSHLLPVRQFYKSCSLSWAKGRLTTNTHVCTHTHTLYSARLLHPFNRRNWCLFHARHWHGKHVSHGPWFSGAFIFTPANPQVCLKQ